MKARMIEDNATTVILTPAMIATARPTMMRTVTTRTIAARAETVMTIAMNRDTVTG